MNTADFKTKTLIMDRPFPGTEDAWVIGLDIGYSAVKGICPNKAFCFPSYARQVPENRTVLKEPGDTDIRYRDDSGEWVVGALAYEEVKASDVIDSEAELFGRRRYFSGMFRVLIRTGLALGLMKNQFAKRNGRKIVVQTGLPSKYMKSDKTLIQEAFADTHEFEIKIGNSQWKHFDFTLDKDSVFVMPQPMGSLLSVTVGADGKQVRNAKDYFKSNVIIFDPGFGTVDDYVINMGTIIGPGETFSNLGMREVFARTCKDIMDVYGADISIPDLQNKLDSGMVKVIDRKKFTSSKHSFQSFLEKNCEKVCEETIQKMMSVHDFFSDCDYLIATGGTYDAWKDVFNDRLSSMEDLAVIPANINDPELPNIFSNVRGYYYFLSNSLNGENG